MAFGWKTQYEKRVPAEGLSNWEIFSIAEKACRELDWDYLIVDEKTFTATTPTHWTLSEQIIKICPENDEIIFESQSESLDLYEAGRNKKNIEEQLLPAFKKARKRVSYDELQFAANTLRTETIRQIRSGNRIASEKMTFGLKDHEVTFMLIAVNLLVFLVMVIRHVDYVNPAVKDIIEWGGNLQFNVTAGMGGVMLINSELNSPDNQLSVNLSTGSFNAKNINVAAAAGNETFKNTVSYTHQSSDGYRQQSAMHRDIFTWDSKITASKKQQISTHFLLGDLFYQTPGALTKAQFLADPKAARPAAGGFPGAIQNNASISQKMLWLGVEHQYTFNDHFKNSTSVYGAFTNCCPDLLRFL